MFTSSGERHEVRDKGDGHEDGVVKMEDGDPQSGDGQGWQRKSSSIGEGRMV